MLVLKACVRMKDRLLNSSAQLHKKFDYETENITYKAKRHCTKPEGSEFMGVLNLHSNQNCTININLSN